MNPEIRAAPFPFDLREVEGSIPSRFGRVVEFFPDRPAIDARGERLTYRELRRAAAGIAAGLLDRLGEGQEPVALLFERTSPAIPAILGALMSGKFYVPLDPLDPGDRLRALVHDIEPRLLLTDREHLPLAREIAGPACHVLEADTLAQASPTIFAPPLVRAEAFAYVIFTSGSTGRPKGVIQNHRNVLIDIRRQGPDLGITPSDRFGLVFPYGTSASISHIFGSLLHGATLLPFDIKREGLRQLGSWLRDERVTVFDSTVSTFRAFVATLTVGETFPDLRLLGLGGEPVHRGDVEAFRRQFPSHCLLQNAFGMTEARIVAQFLIDNGTHLDEGAVPIGFDVEGKQVLLLDEHAVEVASGQCGEIAVRSRYLSPGYWRDPELTRSAFRELPGGERLYLTGDLGRRLGDGRLVHLGRKDFQVKIAGFRVEVEEVEAALQQSGAILEAAVVARDLGRGNEELVAYLVAARGDSRSTETLRRELGQRLPAHMVPSRFVFLEAIPLTPGGKIDRQALPAPPLGRHGMSLPVAPRNHTELRLLEIWEELLGSGGIGVRDGFFDLGGDSLLAARLFAEIEAVFGTGLPLESLIHAPTVEHLAQLVLDAHSDHQWPSLVRLQRGRAGVPIFFVHGIAGDVLGFRHLAARLGKDRPVYGLRAQELDRRHPRLPRVKDMAAKYCEEITGAWPTGPYFVAGQSLGGWIAFEIAKQLSSQGREVRFIGLIDSYGPGYPSFPSTWSRLSSHLRAVRGLEYSEALGYISVRAGALRRRLLRGLSRVAERAFARVGHRPPVTLDNLEGSKYLSAIRAYKPKRYAGKLTLFRAEVQPVGCLPDAHLGWKALASAGVEVYNVPGTHGGVLEEPHVVDLARAIERAIDLACPDAVTHSSASAYPTAGLGLRRS